MTFNKGIDHITAFFSLFFITSVSFYLVTIFPKPQHLANACTLHVCVMSKTSPTPKSTSIAQAKTEQATITPSPAFIALIPTSTPTPISAEHLEITPSPTSDLAKQVSQSEQTDSSAPVPPQPDSPHSANEILAPVTSLVTKTTDLLR